MDKNFLQASFLRALKGVDATSFEKVTILLQNKQTVVTVYLKSKPTEEIHELISEIESEMLADLDQNSVLNLSFKVEQASKMTTSPLEIVIFP